MIIELKNLIGNRLSSLKQSRFSGLQLMAFVLVFAGIGSYILIGSHAAPPPQADYHARQNVYARLTFVKQQLQQASLDESKNLGRKKMLLAKIKPIASARKQELLGVFKDDPATARKLVLSDDVASNLKQNGADVEQPITLTGKLAMRQEDTDSGDHIYTQLVTGDNKTYTLDTEQAFPNIPLRTTVRVHGKLIDDQLLLDSSAAPNSTASQYTVSDPVIAAASGGIAPVTVVAAATSTTQFTTMGNISDMVMIGNFGGGVGTVDNSKIQAVYSGTPGNDLVDYVSTGSTGKATLVSTIVSYDLPSVACGNSTNESNALESAATAANYNLSNYEIHTYITNCNEGSYASAGGVATIRYISISYPNNSQAQRLQYAVFHETSHTLDSAGILNQHSGYLDCAPNAFVPPVNSDFDNSDCQIAEYQDAYEALGSISNQTGYLGAVHRLQANWLDSTQLATVTTNGSYTLAPYENSSGLLALKIPRGSSGSYLTVEYRQPLSFDSYITNTNPSEPCAFCNASQGALIRLGGIGFSGPGGGVDSSLLDNSPGTQTNASLYWPDGDDGSDGALLPGKSFTDPEYGITLTTGSPNSSGLPVQVTLSGAVCNHAAPTVSATSPSSQTVAPGGSAKYTFTITNNDSSGCAANQFRYNPPTSGGVDNGYTFYGGTQVSLTPSQSFFSLSPGASATITLTASSNTGTPDGTYLTNSNGSAYTGYVETKTFGISNIYLPSINFIVSSASDATVPTAPSNPSITALGSALAKLSWSGSSDNTGVAGYQIMQNNSNIYYTTDTSIMLQYLLPSTTYTYTIQAFDHKWNKSAAATINLTTPAKSDSLAPSPPGNVTFSATDHSITATWTAAHDNVGAVCYVFSGSFVTNQNCIQPANNSYSAAVNNLPSNFKGTYTVQAFDGDGNVTSSLNYYVWTAMPGDAAAPSAPQQLYEVYHTHAGTLMSWQSSTDDKSIAGYNVYRGCCKIAYTTTNSYLDPVPTTGPYRVQAVDTDGSLSSFLNGNGVYSQGGGPATGDTTPPTAAVSSPSAGSMVSGTITLQSSASDNVGVTKVMYYIDGNYLTSSSNGPTFPVTLDTTTYGEGPHYLFALAEDAAENTGSSSPITVTFNNNGTSVKSGDLNNDGIVNAQDLSILLSNYGTSNSAGDVNKDGTVNAIDLSILLSHYGQ